MYAGHGIGCFMLRQMEYDADSYEIKLAGSKAFEDTSRRLHVLGHTLDQSYKSMRVGFNNARQLPGNFPAYLLRKDADLPDAQRVKLEDTLGLHASGLFDTHPSWGDRIRLARQAQQPGIFELNLPATALFTNFNVPAEQVSRLHYTDDLGIPDGLAQFVPVERASA
jgi:hypothetical protein